MDVIFAQQPAYSIHGVISDSITRSPVPDAGIYVSDLRRGTVSGEDGFFIINGLRPGKYLLEIRIIGYSTLVKRVEVSSDTKCDVTVSTAVAEIDEVIFTGVSQATEARNNPVPSTIMGRQAMLEGAGNNLIDVISKQPGISQITTGPAISKPMIRGLGYNRLVTLNNGMRQEGQQWGDEHGIEIDEYSIDRAEIIRGPGSLMYGSDAMAGVINFIAPRPVDAGKVTGEILTNYQSNNGQTGFSAMNAGNIKGINWLGRISGKRAGNYQNRYDGKVYNSSFNELNYNAGIGVTKNWGFSNLSFSKFTQTVSLPEGERDSSGHFVKPVVTDSGIESLTVTASDLDGYNIGIPHQRIDHSRASFQNLFIIRKGSLRFNIAVQQNNRREFGDPESENTAGLSFQLNTINCDLRYSRSFLNWETTFGVSGMNQKSSNKANEFLIPAYLLNDIGLYVVTNKTFKRLTISGGFRLDQRHVDLKELILDSTGKPVSVPDNNSTMKFAGIARSFSNFAASAGASWSISEKLLLKLNIARGFRAPNAAELASNGAHEGTLRYEYGSPHLNAENSLQGDLGLNIQSEHLTIDAAVFTTSIANYIFVEKLQSSGGGDSIPDVLDPLPAFIYTSGNAKLSGGEILVDFHPHPFDWLHFQNSFSYVTGINRNQPDSAKYLPNITPPRYLGELRANLNSGKSGFTRAFIYFQLEHWFAQNNVLLANNTETFSSAYTLLNAGFGFTLQSKKKKPIMSVYLSANNLADIAYQQHLSRLRYGPVNSANGMNGIWNMGRNISVKVLVPLVFKNK